MQPQDPLRPGSPTPPAPNASAQPSTTPQYPESVGQMGQVIQPSTIQPNEVIVPLNQAPPTPASMPQPAVQSQPQASQPSQTSEQFAPTPMAPFSPVPGVIGATVTSAPAPVQSPNPVSPPAPTVPTVQSQQFDPAQIYAPAPSLVSSPQPVAPGSAPAAQAPVPGQFLATPAVGFGEVPGGVGGPVTSQPFAPFNPMQPASAMPNPDHNRKKLLFIIIGAVAGALLLAAIAVVVNTMRSIKLTAYSTDEYSLQVPADYKKTESGDGLNFSEDDNKDTRSEVIVYYAALPDVDAEQIKTIKDTLRTQLKTAADDLAEGNKEVANLAVTEVKYHDEDALQLTADIKSDDAVGGKIKLIAVVNAKQFYMVGVAAHASDKGLEKKQDFIIDSFTVK